MRASFLGCPIDVLTMADTVELASRATRGCTDSPPKYRSMPRGNPSVFRPNDGASCPRPTAPAAAAMQRHWMSPHFAFLLSHSLLEYAFEYLISLRLDGTSLGYKG